MITRLDNVEDAIKHF